MQERQPPPETHPETHPAAADSTELIARMDAAIAAEDGPTFVRLVREIDWSQHTAEDLLRAIDFTIWMDMGRLAMELAKKGGELFPEHERARAAAHVLTPPTARLAPTNHERARSLRRSDEWLSEHAHAYVGQWVAVRHGQLLGVAPDLHDLMPLIGEGEDARWTLVHRVLG